MSGFSPLITTASPHNKDLLISHGATHVLDRTLSSAALREQVAQITKTPITYIFDAVSLQETQEAALPLLAPGGTLGVVTQPKVDGDEGNKKVLMVFGTTHIPQNRELGAKFSIALTKWLAEGAIKVCTVPAGAFDAITIELELILNMLCLQPNLVEVLPGGLKGVASGLRKLGMNGVSATKLVVRPADTPDC